MKDWIFDCHIETSPIQSIFIEKPRLLGVYICVQLYTANSLIKRGMIYRGNTWHHFGCELLSTYQTVQFNQLSLRLSKILK